MFDGYKNIQNAHGLHALLKAPTFPAVDLAIGGDDEMSDVPLIIFRDPRLPMPGPTVDSIQNMPYEALAKKGANDTLSLDDFTTDDFNLGDAYASLI